uniref:Uncharacterized protein n=1 Tax=Ascaris lumbricoides TaxID=6252 RepID=A0A0M3I6R1_ASCLU
MMTGERALRIGCNGSVPFTGEQSKTSSNKTVSRIE